MDAKTTKKGDNTIIEMIKLILLIYNNLSIVKKVVNKIEWVKSTLSHLPMNTEFIIDKLVFIKTI